MVEPNELTADDLVDRCRLSRRWDVPEGASWKTNFRARRKLKKANPQARHVTIDVPSDHPPYPPAHPQTSCRHVRDCSNSNDRCANRIKAYWQLAGCLAARLGRQLHRNLAQTPGEPAPGLTPSCAARRGKSGHASHWAKLRTVAPANRPRRHVQ